MTSQEQVQEMSKVIEALQLIQSDLKAPKGQYNKFGKYKYRSCEDIMEALKPLLSRNNCTLVLHDEMVLIGDRYFIKATATLWKGATRIAATALAREPLTQKGMNEAQITGSVSSYARKYALNGLFCIDDTVDADGSNDHKDAPAKPKVDDWRGLSRELWKELSAIDGMADILAATKTKHGNDFKALYLELTDILSIHEENGAKE